MERVAPWPPAEDGRHSSASGSRVGTREGRGRRGRQGPGMRQTPTKGKGERGADRGDSGHRPNALSNSSRRGRPHRSVHREETARYEALAHIERQRRRHQPPEPGPDTIYRLEMGPGRGRSERQGGQEGSGGVHIGQPSGGPQRGEGQAGSHHFRHHLTLGWGWCTHPHRRLRAYHRRRLCCSTRRPAGRRGGHREGRERSTGGHGRG